MKYFTVLTEERKELMFFSVSGLRKYLKEHPEVREVERWWWSRNDLIEAETFSREEILSKRATELKSGQTAQWASDHGTLRE